MLTKNEPTEVAALRQKILELAGEYARLAHAPKPFVPGSSPVAVSGKVVGEPELQYLIDASLDLWLTTGRYNTAFETKLAEFLGRRFVLTCNSGSSANLLATTALCSPRLRRPLRPGDEVITCAAGFPTTVNPSLQNGLVPVFIDADIPTYNANPEMIEAAVTPRTRAIILAHTLGNPFDLDEVMRVAKKYDLVVMEDCCDALGAKYDGKMVGTFGDVGTLSFYPAHHITMGEGGAVFTSRSVLKRQLESIRDWGRDCYCEPGHDDTCGKRFGWKLGDLPQGYDHKYTYSNTGYNLKITDMQAAVGLAQMTRLDGFIAARASNFAFLQEALGGIEGDIILPQATPKSEPSWFGYPITIRSDKPGLREELVQELNDAGIATRLLFGGNLIRQPYMKDHKFLTAGDLSNSDKIMNCTLWIGLFPGLTEAHLDFAAGKIRAFFKGAGRGGV
jgi:CDP-6-deoxy-D-xylo-4-hexulose-3-dehydrase